MGNCVGAPVSQEPPRCTECGVSGTIPWFHMSQSQRNSFWVERKGAIRCKACASGKRQERQRQEQAQAQEREQERIKQLKESLYPRAKSRPTLKRIQSGEPWESSRSFHDVFPLPLSAAARDRSAGAAAASSSAAPAGQAEQVQQAQQAVGSAQRSARLEQVEQDLMAIVVEEEELVAGPGPGIGGASSDGSGDGGSDSPTGVICGAARDCRAWGKQAVAVPFPEDSEFQQGGAAKEEQLGGAASGPAAHGRAGPAAAALT